MNGKNKKSENTSEELLILQESQKLKQIENISNILFSMQDWIKEAYEYTKYPQESWDFANLYTIIKINNKDVLIKIWKWNFNLEVFNQKEVNKQDLYTKETNDYSQLKWFANTPVPLFVVDQVNSTFADETQKLDMNKNPKKYLEENSIIVVPKTKQAYLNHDYNINFNDINILHTDDAIKQLQNAILKSKFSNNEMWSISKTLEDRKNKTLEKFQSTIDYKDKHDDNPLYKKLIWLLKKFVPEEWDIKQVYNLIQTYNKNKNIFE